LRLFDKYSPFLFLKPICLFSNLSVFGKGSTLVLLRNIVLILLLALLSDTVFAIEDKTFCVWDPVGRTGPVMTFYSDVIPKAQAWGLRLKFVAYTEETDAVKEFKAGNCEAVVITSILSRQFVQFAGTMDAIGAINSQEGLELAIATLSRPRAGNLMIEGNHEVVTTFPIGSMYAFVKDRSVDTIEEFAGKKLAILNDDPQMKKFADLAGASYVNVTLSDFAEKFEKGIVDILIMPALAYNTFELYKGLGEKGGIIDYRLYYGMLQTISRRDQFPEDFGFNMRNYMLTRLKEMNKMVLDAEEEIPDYYWIETNQFVKDDIDHFSKRVRLSLQDSDVNNSTALKLFWKIRCRLDPSRGECKVSPDQMNIHGKQLAEKNLEDERVILQKKILQQKKLEKASQAAKEQNQLEQDKLALAQEIIEKERLKQEKISLEKQALNEERLALEQERLEQEKLVQEQENLAQEQTKLDQEQIRLEQDWLAFEKAKAELKESKRSLWDILFGWIRDLF
jgi:hypothetical protein